VRRTIALKATPRRPGARLEVRLFSMNDRQSKLFEDLVEVLVRTGVPVPQAAVVVEKAVVSLLAGKMPAESLPSAFHRMRLTFPILKPKDVKRLPRAGCPRGRVTAVVLQMALPQEDAAAPTTRTVLLRLDRDQADFYNDAIADVSRRDGCTKDEAWEWTTNLVGRMIAGAVLKGKTDEVLLMRAVNLFPGLTKEEAFALPLATEEDLRRWSFTEDRAR